MIPVSRSFHTFCFMLLYINCFAYCNNISFYSEINGTYDTSKPYCFRFTWLGTEFTNQDVINKTCAEILDAKRDYNIPCRNPLVITYDGSPPDINYIWEHHRDQAVTRQANGQVCVKYSYIYNNVVQNITYLTTKVSMSGALAVTDGCYRQTVDGHEVELCVCESFSGIGKPCNTASRNAIPVVTLILTISLITP